MRGKSLKLDELIEKYRFWIGGILILAIVCGSAILLWRENYQKPSLESRIKNLESKISQLKADEEQDTNNNNQPNSNGLNANTQTVAEGQVAGANSQSKNQSEAPSVPSNTQKPSGKININTASESELDFLPGIGATYAKRIVEYRNSNGGFKSISEIKNVKGIGDKTFEKFKDLITI